MKTVITLILTIITTAAHAGTIVYTDRIQWEQALTGKTSQTYTFEQPYQLINKGTNTVGPLTITTDADDPGAGFSFNLIPQNRIEDNKLQFRVSNGISHSTGRPLSTYLEIDNHRPIKAFGADYVGAANSAILQAKIGNEYVDFSNYFQPTATAAGFLGIIANQSIDAIHFEAKAPAADNKAEFLTLDNLSIYNAPEPNASTLIAFSITLGAWILSHRRFSRTR